MNYIAYTIGPIYDTILASLNDEQKTKRLQAGSAFFSNFMRELLIAIKDDFTVLVPHTGGDALSKGGNMGVFHDRFIAISPKAEEKIREIFAQRLKEVQHLIAKEIGDPSLTAYFDEAMQNHLLVASNEALKSVDDNIIFALNKLLDALELQRRFSLEPLLKEHNPILSYQQKHIETSRVKTIEAISKEIGMPYYAVVTADGDKMGDKIKSLATEDVAGIRPLSKTLYNFFTAKEEGGDLYDLTTERHGGILIYAGGDDILALLPVKKEDNTVLDYIQTLDKRFKKHVGDDVSLSFGVNIAYYKYPLRDAVNEAFDLLYDAKSHAPNSVSIKLTKHSGQWFEMTQALSSDAYTKWYTLVEGVLNERLALPHTFHHSVARYRAAICKTYEDEHGSVGALFEMVFADERKQEEKEGIEKACELFDAFRPKDDTAFDALFSALAIIKFLREDRQ